MPKDFFNKNKRFIFIGAGVIVLACLLLFYFVFKTSEPPQKEEKQLSSGDPVSLFVDLLSRQRVSKFQAVYDSTLEESSTSTVKRVILAVKQTDGKRKSDIWFNTAKVLSVIQNTDGMFACSWASDYKSPPCYKMSAKGALAEDTQAFSGGQLERLKAMAVKGILDVYVQKKSISVGGSDRACADFSYSLKANNMSAGDVRGFFPMIRDVSDDDIAQAVQRLSLIKNSARVCLDLESGVPLETDISFTAGTSAKHSMQHATYFTLNPVFNEQLALDPIKRFDGPLFQFAFGKMIGYNDNLYVSANGIMRIRDGKMIDTKTGFGNVNDFIAHKGTLYAAAGKGIFRLAKDNEWELMKKNKSTFGEGFNTFKELNGVLYAMGEFTNIFRLDNVTWMEAGTFPRSLLTDALYDYNGSLYARSELDGVFRLEGNTWIPFLTPADFGGATKIQLKTYHGKLYATVGSAIYKIENNKPIQIGSYKDYGLANVFFEHPEDGMYVGSAKGLFLVTDTVIREEATKERVGEVNSVTIFGGNLYIGTNQGVYRKENNAWRRLSWEDDVGPINAFYEFNHDLYAAGALGIGKLTGNEWVTTPINLEDEKQNANIENAGEVGGRMYVITKDSDNATLYAVRSIQKDGDEFALPAGAAIIEVPIVK